MGSKNLLQQIFGLMVVVLLMAGCGGTESVSPAAAVSSADTPTPAKSASLITATPCIDMSIPIEQAMIGTWVTNEDDPHNRRYHVYTQDGRHCFGPYLPVLLEEDSASCKAYELDGNVLSEICTEESIGCTAGDTCKVEMNILEDGRLQYFLLEACPGYPAGHPVIREFNYFVRVEEP
jgi:hypothetical protein